MIYVTLRSGISSLDELLYYYVIGVILIFIARFSLSFGFCRRS